MTGYQKFSATRVADRAPSAPKGNAELIGRRISLDGLGALGEVSLQSPSWGYRKFIANGNSDDAPFPPKPPKVPAGEVGSQPSLDGLGALGGVPAQSRFLAPSDAAIHWEAEDWRTYYDERAGIAEFCGGLSRHDADAQAFACCVIEWQKRHPVATRPGLCSLCGSGELPGRAVLKFGIEGSYFTWVHHDCWPAWSSHRRDTAINALIALGIDPPAVQYRR